eukprot:scaffold43047_cov42-Cyclotella_meneghiniana.AAC.2
MGEPSTRKPSVTSTGDLLLSVEYCCMACCKSVPVMTAPSFSPSSLNLSRKYLTSSWCRSRMSFNTMAAKVGEAGHPCEKPSLTVITVHDPSSNLTKGLFQVPQVSGCRKGGGVSSSVERKCRPSTQ